MRIKANPTEITVYLFLIICMLAPSSGHIAVRISRVVVTIALMIPLILQKIRISHKKDYYYFFWAIAFLLFCGIGIKYAINRSVTTHYFSTLLYVLIINILILLYTSNRPRIVDGIIHTLIIGATLSGVVAFAKYGFLAFLSSRMVERTSGNSIGQYSAFAAVLILYVLRSRKEVLKKSSSLYKVLFIVNLIFVVLSASRKSLLYLLLPLIVDRISRSKNPIKIIENVIGSFFLIVIVYFCLMKIGPLYKMVGHRIETLINGIKGIGRTDSSTYTRLILIQRGLEWFRQRPILGYGLAGFHAMNESLFGSSYYAHNNYVEMLVDGGIIGTVIYYSLYIRSLVNYFKNRKTITKDNTIFLGLLISILVCDYGMVTYNDIFTQTILLIVFMVSGGFLTRMPKNEMRESETRQYE